jgi:hypothetical protein
MSRSSSSWKYILFTLVLTAGTFVLGRMTASKNSAPQQAALSAATPLDSIAPAATPTSPTASSPTNSPSALGLDTASARFALNQLDQTTPSERREEERLKLLIAWAATDPIGAIEYAKKNLKLDRLAQAMSGIATTWAKDDPSAAWTWSRSLGTNNYSQTHTVLEEIGRNDPALATHLATDFASQQPDEAVTMCMTAMRGMTYNGNFDAAMKLATTVQFRSPDEQAMLLNYMAGQWASFEPEKAAQWVQNLPEGQSRNQALVGLASSWAEKDAPKAADFAEQLPAGQVRQTALRQAIGNWIMTDPVAASTWINQFPPSEDFDQAVASVATMHDLVEEHVDVALSWAGTIVNDSLRSQALNQIISTWALQDRAAALKYAQTAPGLSPDARDQLTQQLQLGGQ